MSLVGTSCSLEGFLEPHTTKSVQNVTHFGPKQLSKPPCVARKCRQSAFLVTKMHFASLRGTQTILFSVGVGGWFVVVDVGHWLWLFCFLCNCLMGAQLCGMPDALLCIPIGECVESGARTGLPFTN